MDDSVDRVKKIVEKYKNFYYKNLTIRWVCLFEPNIFHEYFTIISAENKDDIGAPLKTVLHREGIPDKVQDSIFKSIKKIIESQPPNRQIRIYSNFKVEDVG